MNQSFTVWSLPAHTDHTKILGGPRRRITTGASEILPSVSADERMLAFTATRNNFRIGGPNTLPEETAEIQVRIKDLLSGKETVISDNTGSLWHPQLSLVMEAWSRITRARRVRRTLHRSAENRGEESSAGKIRFVVCSYGIGRWTSGMCSLMHRTTRFTRLTYSPASRRSLWGIPILNSSRPSFRRTISR